MKIWKQDFTLEGLNASSVGTIGSLIGIEFIEFGDDFLRAKMPVDDRTVQPARILHGGASVVLAETLGSVASVLCIENRAKKMPVGLEINANHLSPGRYGTNVIGTCRPIRIGKTIHVWNIEITTPEGKLVCVSRLTTAIVDIGGN
jgi:1,4-dihydroxy-2-naphthoyl-CoA hydrolase